MACLWSCLFGRHAEDHDRGLVFRREAAATRLQASLERIRRARATTDPRYAKEFDKAEDQAIRLLAQVQLAQATEDLAQVVSYVDDIIAPRLEEMADGLIGAQDRRDFFGEQLDKLPEPASAADLEAREGPGVDVSDTDPLLPRPALRLEPLPAAPAAPFAQRPLRGTAQHAALT